MEAKTIGLAHSCWKQFPIMDEVSIMGKAIGPPVGNTTIQVLIHKDAAGALVLTKISLPQFTFWSKHYHTKTFSFERKLWSVGSSCWRFLLLSNLGIYPPKDYLNQGLNTSERNWWDGNSLVHQCLRGSVDVHFGYCLYCFDLSEQREYWQSSIPPRLEWCLTCLYFKDQILMFLTQKIRFFMLNLKISNAKILIWDTEHIPLVHRSILIPHYGWQFSGASMLERECWWSLWILFVLF